MDKKVLITNSQGAQVAADVVMAFKLNDNQKWLIGEGFQN